MTAPWRSLFRPRWELGFTLPLILSLGILSDALLRFLPIETVAFRGWEAATLRGRVDEGPFRPNYRYENPHSYGDLAPLGNYPELRQFRPDVFTTDEYGYRNPPDPASGTRAFEILLLGDSFAAGAGNADDDMPSRILSDVTGRRVYNAGGTTLTAAETIELASMLRMKRGLVVYFHLERDREVPVSRSRLLRVLRGARNLIGAKAWLTLRGVISHQLAVSPLEVWAQRLHKALSNDVFWPNRYSANVLRARLRNGTDMLFLSGDPSLFASDRHEEVAGWTDYFRSFEQELAVHNLALLLVIIPEKFTVYYPLLVHAPQARQPEPYTDMLERALLDGGLRVVGSTSLLSTEAAMALDQGSTLYWLDDTHWNRKGIEIVSRLIEGVLLQQN